MQRWCCSGSCPTFVPRSEPGLPPKPINPKVRDGLPSPLLSSPLLSCLLVAVAANSGMPLRGQQVPPPPAGTPLLGSWLPPFQHPMHDCNPHSPLPQPTGFNAVHASLIPVDPRRPSNPWGGKVLVWDESHYASCGAVGGDFHQRWAIVDPDAGTVQTYTWVIPASEAPAAWNPNLNGPTGNQGLFCSGHCWLRDGKLLVVGGNDWSGPAYVGSQLVTMFDPWAGSPATAWSVVKDANQNPLRLQRRRWYPTVMRLADAQDTVCVFGGVETWNFTTNTVNPAEYAHRTYEAFQTNVAPPVGPWSVDQRTGITVNGTQQFGLFGGPGLATSNDEFFYYPRFHLLSRQALQNASANGIAWMGGMVTESCWVEHVAQPMVWPAPRPILPNGHNLLEESASIVFPNVSPLHEDLIVQMGGEEGFAHQGGITNRVWLLPARNPLPAWTNLAALDLLYARKFHKAVLLPDTAVLLVGGGQDPMHGGAGLEVFWPEVFLQGQWRYCAKEQVTAQDPTQPVGSPRTYHSCALLLPSGNVLSCGGNTRIVDYHVFRPHYFDGAYKRPEWTVAAPPPTTLAYGQPFQFGFTLPFGLNLDKVVLTTPGSSTHAQDPGQRCIQLPFTVSDTGAHATATAPASASHAIPGCYMLWLVSSAGVPSVAQWVFLQ